MILPSRRGVTNPSSRSRDNCCETAAWHYLIAAVDLASTPEAKAEAHRYLKMIEREE